MNLENNFNRIEKEIENIWTEKIKDDFLNRYLVFSEHELAASFYYYLRNYIEDTLEDDTLRIFLEYKRSEKQREKVNDLIIMRSYKEEWNAFPLMTYFHEEIVIAIEFKFRQYIRTKKDIEKDLNRLFTLTKKQKNIKRFYYASIGYLDLELFEKIISKKPKEFSQLLKLALGMPKIKDDTDINYSKKDNWNFYVVNVNKQ